MDMKYNLHNIFRNHKSIVFIIIAVLILIVRKSDSLSNPQLWAEDGTIFFAQQYEYGTASIFTAYAGYLHIVPRLIAAFTDLFFSYANAPAVYNYTSLIITIIVIANCFSPRLQLPFKPLLALSVVVVPQALNEVFLNIANLQWILCILLILTLLKDVPNIKYGNYTLQVLTDFLVIIFTGLTGPFLIIMFPFFVWKLIRIKKAYGYTLLTAAFCIVLVQFFTIISSTEGIQNSSLLSLDIYISIFGRKLFGGLFFGKYLLYSNALLISIGSLAYFTVLLYLAYKRSPTDKQILKIVSIVLGISAAILVSVVIKNSPDTPIFIGSRYFYIPYVMIAWSLIICINKHGIWKNIFVMSSLLLITCSSLSVGIQTSMIDYSWKYHAGLIGTKSIVIIPINPTWYITLHSKTK